VKLGLREKGVFRRLSEPRRGDATEWWRKVRTGELGSVHSLPNIISMIKWDRQIVRMGQQCTKLPSVKQEGTIPFGKSQVCTGGPQWILIYSNGLEGRELDYRTVLALLIFWISHNTRHVLQTRWILKAWPLFYFIFLWRYSPKSGPRCLVFTPVITALNIHDTKWACFFTVDPHLMTDSLISASDSQQSKQAGNQLTH